MENITKAKATSLEHVDLTVADSQLSISQRFKFTFCSVFHLLHHFAIQLNHLLHWGQTSRDCFRTTKIAAQQVEELHEISVNAVSWRPGSQKEKKKKSLKKFMFQWNQICPITWTIFLLKDCHG